MNFICAGIFFIILLFLIEILKRFFSLSGELSRKLAHISSASAIFFLPYFLNKWQIIILASSFVLLLSISKWLDILRSLHLVKRKTWGEIFLPTGVVIAASLFLPHNIIVFQFGILIMGFSDGLAGILGKKFGERQFNIFGAEKTYFGSLVFFVSTFIIFMFFTHASVYVILAAMLVSLFLTIVEAMFDYGVDNLVLPIIAGYMLMFFV